MGRYIAPNRDAHRTVSPGRYIGPDRNGKVGAASSVAPKKGGHGFWHEVSLFGQGAKNAAVNLPGGLYEAGKAISQDEAHRINKAIHGHPGQLLRAGDPVHVLTSGRTGQITKAYGKQVVEDFQHPGRNPFNTFSDVAALLSGGAGAVARISAAGKLAKAGESASVVRRALTERPASQIRHIKVAGREDVVSGSYSRNALVRPIEKAADKRRLKNPNKRILSPKTQMQRRGDAIRRNEQRTSDIEKAQSTALTRMAHKLSDPQHKAIQIVGEGVAVNARIRFHKAQLRGFAKDSPEYVRTKQEIGLLEAAKQYVTGKNGSMKIRPQFTHLRAVTNQARKVAVLREKTLKSAGVLGPGSTSRIHAPGRIILGDEEFNGGQFRIPYKWERGGPENLQLGARNSIGIPRTPSTVRHPFEGAILSAGGGRTDIAHLIAESHIESQRYGAAVRLRKYFLNNSQPIAAGLQDPVAIRVDAWKNKTLDPDVGRILRAHDTGHKLTPAEESVLMKHHDNFISSLFDETADPRRMEAQPGVRWIDRSELGGLDNPHPMVGFRANKSGRTALSVTDTINNASRDAILYLKPSYGPANFLGNTALTLVQQGFAAPKHLKEAVTLTRHLGEEDAAIVDEVVGNGITAALKSTQGPLAKSTQWLGGKWQRVIDQPFRRASFMYEASKQGFKTSEQVHDLLHRTVHRDKLHQIVDLANKELIDYGNLGPMEREIIRRTVFFYPWVKGSTVYAGRFVKEHPIQTAATAQLGRRGKQLHDEGLGLSPDWAEALIRTGGNNLIAKTLNPASSSILQTPADIAQAVTGGGAQTLAQNFTPALSIAATAATGVDALGRPVKGNRIVGALKQSYQGLPAYRLYDAMTHSQKDKTFPVSKEQAFLLWLIGSSFVPRNTNLAKLHKSGYAQRHPH